MNDLEFAERVKNRTQSCVRLCGLACVCVHIQLIRLVSLSHVCSEFFVPFLFALCGDLPRKAARRYLMLARTSEYRQPPVDEQPLEFMPLFAAFDFAF